MLNALKNLIESKKFWTMILGVITILGTKYGFQVEPNTVYLIGGLFAVLLGAQGLQDQGSAAVAPCPKCAANDNVAKTPDAPVASTPVKSASQAGFARVGLLAGISLAILVACGSSQLASCAGCRGPLPIPISDIIDCGKLEATPDFAGATGMLTADLGDWNKMLTDVGSLGLKFGVDVARCAAMELIQQYVLVKHAPETKASTWDGQSVAEAIRAAAKADLAKQRAAAGEPVPNRDVSFKTGKGKSL